VGQILLWNRFDERSRFIDSFILLPELKDKVNLDFKKFTWKKGKNYQKKQTKKDKKDQSIDNQRSHKRGN